MVYSRIKKLKADLEEVFADKATKTEGGATFEKDGIIYNLDQNYKGLSEVAVDHKNLAYQSGFSKRMEGGDMVTLEYKPELNQLILDYALNRKKSLLAYGVLGTYILSVGYSLATGTPMNSPAMDEFAIYAVPLMVTVGALRNSAKIESTKIKKAERKLETVYAKLKRAASQED